MNRLYTIIAAAVVAVGATAQVADFRINEDIRRYTPEVSATRVNTAVVPAVEARSSRADHWCEGAMYHYDDTFYRVDQFEMAVDLSTADIEDTVYTLHGMYASPNNPEGSSVEFIVHPDGTVTVPVQAGPFIPDFWTFSGDVPSGLRDYAFICDIYTGETAMSDLIYSKLTGIDSDILRRASFYDPETGVVRLMVITFFMYNGLELNNGMVIDTLYPFDFVLPFLEEYNVIRSETLQLGNWGEMQTVDYTDSYLPAMGFDPETYQVALQKNTMFDATCRIVHPFLNNSQLNASDFITDGAGNPIDAAMLIYSYSDDEYFLGRTYSGLHIDGMNPAEFMIDSYVNYMLINGSTKEDVRSLTGITNNGSVLYDGKPFGRLENGSVTIPEYCNFFIPISEVTDTESGLTILIPDNDPYFVPNNLFKLDSVGGVESVSTDRDDAPVVYYNLQGIRVSCPVAGHVYIRRQGSDVAKMLF